MKRAVLYMSVSTLDQHPETQLHDLRQMAAQRGYRPSTSSPTASAAPRPSGRASIR
jgi:DNA invertase Pin-like site-specific DNA recombinase